MIVVGIVARSKITIILATPDILWEISADTPPPKKEDMNADVKSANRVLGVLKGCWLFAHKRTKKGWWFLVKYTKSSRSPRGN